MRLEANNKPWRGSVYGENDPPEAVKAGIHDEVLSYLKDSGTQGETMTEVVENVSRYIHEDRESRGSEAPYKTDDVRIEMIMMAGVAIEIETGARVYLKESD